MKNVLIAVDDTKGSKAAVTQCTNVCKCIQPKAVILVYVEKYEGRSLMDEMLGKAEMSTLKDVLEGTEYKERLDAKANTIINYYKKALEDGNVTNIKTVIREGHPAEEILKVAKEEQVDMIMMGSRGKRSGKLFMGSVSREVANESEIPVLLMK